MHISLHKLINYPFPEETLDGIWGFSEILEELQIDIHRVNYELFDANLFNVKVIYDNQHGSDESSYRKIMFFKGEFCCIYGYTGDRGSRVLLFASKQQRSILESYFISLYQESDYGGEIIGDVDALDLSDNYTRLMDINGVIYNQLQMPRWSYRFQKNCIVYVYNEDESMSPATFIKFKNPEKQSYEEKEVDKFMVLLIDGQKKPVEIEYERVFLKS